MEAASQGQTAAIEIAGQEGCTVAMEVISRGQTAAMEMDSMAQTAAMEAISLAPITRHGRGRSRLMASLARRLAGGRAPTRF